MNKTFAEKYAQRKLRKYKEMLGLLSHEQVEDCTNRSMSQSTKGVKQYLWEANEVVKATIRMKEIDAKIDALPIEESLKREARLESQRRFLGIRGLGQE
jgi:hypothetical protein